MFGIPLAIVLFAREFPPFDDKNIFMRQMETVNEARPQICFKKNKVFHKIKAEDT